MNSDMVKPEKFGHLHLVCHFTVPLTLYMCFLRFFKNTMYTHIVPLIKL